MTMDGSVDMGAVGDESLVAAALDGSRGARAAIYERYADRVHTMCVHMLSDRDEAADACGQVFLVAFDRLAQLRDPSRLRPWIFSITRHEVYRRTRRRRRVDLIGEVEQMDHIMSVSGVSASGALLADSDDGFDDAATAAELVAVVRSAADGLDDKDRLVLELQLQDLGGDELAETLGTSASTAYQHVHRMKERFERSLGALLVARTGRADCDELDELLEEWDGHFSVLWRKRVARHVDRCEICERRRAGLPAALLGGGGAAAVLAGAGPAGASTEFPAPASVRDRVLGPADGSGAVPVPGRTRHWRTAVLAGGGIALVLVVLAVLAGLGVFGSDGGDEIASTGAPTSTVPGSTTTTTTSTSTTVVDVPVDPVPEVTVPVPATPDVVAPPLVAPPAQGGGDLPGSEGQVTPAPPETTVPPVPPAAPPSVAPPRVELVLTPTTLHHPTPGFDSCGASMPFEVDSSAAAVHLRWRAGSQAGRVDLVRVSPGSSVWRGVLEPAAGVTGPVQVEAVGEIPGAAASSPVQQLTLQPCPTPG